MKWTTKAASPDWTGLSDTPGTGPLWILEVKAGEDPEFLSRSQLSQELEAIMGNDRPSIASRDGVLYFVKFHKAVSAAKKTLVMAAIDAHDGETQNDADTLTKQILLDAKEVREATFESLRAARKERPLNPIELAQFLDLLLERA